MRQDHNKNLTVNAEARFRLRIIRKAEFVEVIHSQSSVERTNLAITLIIDRNRQLRRANKSRRDCGRVSDDAPESKLIFQTEDGSRVRQVSGIQFTQQFFRDAAEHLAAGCGAQSGRC